MKTKITILLISLFIFAFSAQTLAQEKDVAYIIGAETQGYDSVDSILVHINSEVDFTNFGVTWDWDDVKGDFKILDGITNIPIDSINTRGVIADNYFNLFFDTTSWPFGPDKNDLKLHYVKTTTPIPTENGNLQNTSTAVNIDDGIKPLIIADSLYSSNANPFFGEEGDTVTLRFRANEALATIPVAPHVTFTIPEAKADTTVEATMVDGDNTHWSAEFVIPSPGIKLDGKIAFSASFYDVHANQGTLGPLDTGTDGSYVIIKNYDPTYTYAGVGFDETTLPPDHYPGDTEDLIYLWNVFNTIDECVDAVEDDGYVVLCSNITEDPTIDKGLTITSLPVIKGGFTVVGDFDVTSSDVTFDDISLNPDEIAITFNSSASSLDNLTVTDCSFDFTDGGVIGIQIGGLTTPNAVSNIWMEENTFNGPLAPAYPGSNPWRIGGWFGNNVYCDVSSLYFGDNEAVSYTHLTLPTN